MSIRNNYTKDVLMFYELLEESESEAELSATIDILVRAFQSAVCDLCSDNGWDVDDLYIDYDIGF